MAKELSSHLIAFFADSQNGTDFSQGFSLKLIANFDAFKAVWNGSEDFRFILYMGEKRKKRLARNAPKEQRAWSTNVAAAEPKRQSYFGNVSLGICTDTNQGFGCATSEPGQTFEDVAFDGILGMAWNSISVGLVSQPLSQIFKNHQLCAEKRFAFWLTNDNYDVTNSTIGGEFTLCGTNSERYKEPIFWCPLMSTDYWRLSLTSVSLDSLVLSSTNASAILDTGTSLIAGPSSIINKINAKIGAQNYLGGWLNLNCSTLNKLPSVHFTLGGNNFTLNPADYVIQIDKNTCLSGFASVDLNGNMWILGDLFITKWYTIFDHENKRVGLAEAI
uniref:Peptidase A1 domain-containing protein n=1 Tax=Meloidogyne floridensis TaxID=298350 RepID=A0A915NYW9_9BILA